MLESISTINFPLFFSICCAFILLGIWAYNKALNAAKYYSYTTKPLKNNIKPKPLERTVKKIFIEVNGKWETITTRTAEQ